MSSLWMNSVENKIKFNPISDNETCDVCIIGAGITGLSAGYYLSKKGLSVIILDKSDIGTKTSGNTTGKITYQHKLIYDYLINSHSEKFAKGYLEANKEAISNIKNIIDEEQIDCDFEFQSNYVYTTNQEDLPKIHQEIEALNSLGEEVDFVTKSSLPFEIAGALENKNQAQFNLSKYMVGLATSIQRNGGKIFTNSPATDVEGENEGYVTLSNDYKVKSKYVVVATHFPFINFPRILFFEDVSIYFLCYRSRYSFKFI